MHKILKPFSIVTNKFRGDSEYRFTTIRLLLQEVQIIS